MTHNTIMEKNNVGLAAPHPKNNTAHGHMLEALAKWSLLGTHWQTHETLNTN